MKRFNLLSILLLALPLSIFAQTGPKFVAEGGESINTGSHMRGKEVHYEIKFKNEGDAELKISNVATSCGCSTALASSDVIKPGESGVINFTFNGNGFGTVSKTVTLVTNEAAGVNTHYIQMTMNMVDPVTLTPASIMTTGKVGEDVKQVVTLSNNFDKEITISEVSSNSPAVTGVTDKTTLAVGEGAQINVTIKLFEESAVNAAVIVKTSEGEFQIPILVDVKAN